MFPAFVRLALEPTLEGPCCDGGIFLVIAAARPWRTATGEPRDREVASSGGTSYTGNRKRVGKGQFGVSFRLF